MRSLRRLKIGESPSIRLDVDGAGGVFNERGKEQKVET
jgi:hypothetical protein